MIRYLEDLRFCIGAFFLIVGIMLLASGLVVGTIVAGYNVNLWTGVVFSCFGALSLAFSVRSGPSSK